MSGVGSTNAMKKGSGNNPFIAYSEADMRSYLNSAYTGCIVKYAGPSTKKLMDANASGDAQNLIADTSKILTKGTVAGNVFCNITINDSQTYYRIYDLYIRRSGGVYDPTYVTNPDALPDFIYAVLLVKNYHNKDQYKGKDNIKDMDVTFLAVEESVSENPDLLKLTEKWPLTKGINGWQTNCFNTAGRITLWGYGDTVTYTNNNAYSASSFMYDEPYVVNELYEVVYGNGRYYFEEYYHISDDVTTSTVEDVASGKTFYDFTGTKQTGTGTKINPYLATDIATFKSFPVGSFIKWIGPNKTVLDETTGQMLIQGEIYRAVEDGDVFQYVILPTLSNPADPIDVAEGKEVINQLGAVMIGTGNVVLRAATTEGMQALFTTENIGKVVQYVGETDVYIKEAIYQIVDTSEFKQYYELPALTNEATADDLVLDKELINSKGEKVTGALVPPQIKEGEITPTENANYIYISGITVRPRATSICALNDTNTLKARYVFDYPGNPEDRIGCMYFRGGSLNNYNFTSMVINIENGSLKIGGSGYDFRAGVTYKYRLVL